MRWLIIVGALLTVTSTASAQPERIEGWLPDGSTERFTETELCDRAAGTDEAHLWEPEMWIHCELEPTRIEGFSVVHIQLLGGEVVVLVEGAPSALRVVNTLHRCHAGPGGNSGCEIDLLHAHEAAHRGQTVVSFETESDMFDYDATEGSEIWHRQLTVCAWRGSPADAVCTARVPLGLREVYFTLPDTDLSSPDHWTRTVRDTTELSAIAIVRRDGTIRLRAREGPLDDLSAWFGWRCGIRDDVTLPWDPALVTEVSEPLEAAWQPVWWPPRPLPSHLDTVRIEALSPRCPD